MSIVLPDPQALRLVDADDPVLRQCAHEVTDFSTQVAPYIYPMKAIMRERDGLGLAAPQVGIPYRFFLIEHKGCRLVVNPKIVRAVGERTSKPEGCLSFPGRTTFVPRHENIVVAWIGSQGDHRTMSLAGLSARVFQHERDHLDGICIF